MNQATEFSVNRKWFDESELEVPVSSPEELTAFMKGDVEK